MATGLDQIAQGYEQGLRGKRVALLVNHTAVDQWGQHAVQVLGAAGVKIVRLLGAEHGIWSTHEDMEPVDGTVQDAVFGLPVVSLYGSDKASLEPRPEVFDGVDAIVYDLQDIGSRYYTFAATLALVMKHAAPRQIPVWVLDRPNPIGPRREGPLLREGFESFCGLVAGLPIRHGLTVGQLARWYRDRIAPGCELIVVPCTKDTRLPFVPPSPNMPTYETALVYPGLCLVEGTTLSEGRGTTSPFRQVGAPGVDPLAVVAFLRRKDCPGVDFVPVRFRPHFGKHAGQICGGVYLRGFDPNGLSAIKLGVYLLEAFKKVAPQAWTWRSDAYEFVTDRPAIDLLWGSTALRDTLDKGGDVEALLEAAEAEALRWKP